MNKWIKCSLILLIGFLLCSVLFWNDKLFVQADATWTFVDGGLTTGINYNPSNNATNPVMAVYNNELYAAWEERNGTVSQIRVKKFNGNTWASLDGTNGLNLDPTHTALRPTFIVFNGSLVLAWEETNELAYTAIRVRRYDGSSWVWMDGGTVQGLNRYPCSADNPHMTVFNGELYLAWDEITNTINHIRVKKYNGTTWEFVDGNTDFGLNRFERDARSPNLTVFNNQLYISWAEKNSSGIEQLRVNQYAGGSTWNMIDGNLPQGLNFSESQNVFTPYLMALNNKLYAVWDEMSDNSVTQVHLRRYDGGNTWTLVDNLHRNPDCFGCTPRMAVWNNIAYITWDEEDSAPNYIPQIRVKKYDGSSFSYIDGGVASSQLNYNPSQYAKTPFPIIFNGDLFVAWHQGNVGAGEINQIRVKKYPLPPVITSVTVPAGATYGQGQTLDFIVNFSKTVSVSGGNISIPVTLNTGGTVNANFVSGSGTKALTFRLTINAGMNDTDGIVLGPSLNLNGLTIKDGNGLDAEVNLNNAASTSAVLVDATAPTVSSTTPADNAINIHGYSDLVINFNENVTKGTGNITIKKTTGDSTIETINVSGANVAVTGSTVTINPSIDIPEDTECYVLIDSTAFRDTAGNYFAGISGKNAWNFTTTDSTPPSGYSVNIDQNYINNNNKTAMSFTFAGAEVGATYNYTLTSSGGGDPVTGSGTILSATQQVTDVTTFGLNEGTLTLSVTLTDTVGNIGLPVTDTVVKDTLMPNSYSVAIDQAYINKTNRTAMSFVISGCETGASFTYTITTSGGGGVSIGGFGTVNSGTSKSVPEIDTTALGDGTLTLSVTMSDVSGNPGLPVTDTVVKDTVAPSGYSVDIQGLINKSNQTNFTFAIMVAELGASYQYTITSSGGGTPVSSTGTITDTVQGFTGIDVTGLNDGTLTISVVLTDVVGNAGTAVTDTTNKDTEPPAGYTVAIDQPYINNNNKTAMSFTISGASPGSTYFYTVTSSGGGTAVSGSGPVTNATQKVIDVNTFGLNEGTLTLSVALADSVGNNGANTMDTVVKDTLMPGGYTVEFIQPSINNGNKNAISLKINGGEPGSSYTYTITSSGGGTPVTKTETYSGGVFKTVDNVNVTGLNDGTLTIRLTMKDVAGNAGGEVTHAVIKDTVAPSGYIFSIGQAVINNSNKSNLSFNLSGAEAGASYIYNLTSSGGGTLVNGTGIVTSATQNVTGINAAGLNDGTLTLSVTLTDPAGNKGAEVTRTVKKDTTAPTVILSDSDTDGLVKAGTQVTITATFNEAMTSKPKITIANGGVSGADMTDSGDHKVWQYAWTVPAGDVTATVSVAGVDAAGNAYSGSDMLTFSVDNTAPTITGAVYEDNTHLTVTLSENCKNLVKASNGGFTVRETGGTATYTVTATEKVDDRHVKLTVASMGASGSKGVTVRYAAGTNGTIQDSAGNPLATNSTGSAVAAWNTTAPTLVSAVRTDNTHLTIALSENCVNLTKTNNGGFAVSETGSSTPYVVSAIAKGADSAHVILTVANMGVSGKEGVTVRYTAGGNGTVQDVAGNAMVSDNTGVSVAAWDEGGPTIASSTLAAGNSYIDIVFNEGVYGADNGTSGLNAADFLLTFAANSGTATNVTISSVKKNNGTTASTASALTGGETTVRVFLNVTGAPNGVETIEIVPADGMSIFDKAGNGVSASQTTEAKPLKDKLRPTLISAERTDNTHITVELSENCKSLAKANNGGFTVRETGNPSKVYTVTRTAPGADTSHVILTLGNMGASGKEGVTVKYTAGTNGTIKDIANNALATNSTGLSVAAWDTTAPALVSAVRTDNTHITVTLSENCINLTKTNNGGFTVAENGSSKNYTVSATAKGADSAHVILTVANMGVSGREGVTVRYAAGGNGTIQDVAGNALTDSGVVVAAWDTAEPALNSSTLASNNSYIDITFSEGVYSADNGTTGLNAADFLLTFTANGGTATNVTISSVRKNNGTTASTASALTGGETTVRVFLNVTGTPSGVESIEIVPADGASIFDKAGNGVSASQTTGVKLLKDKLRPTLNGVERTDNTHITVTLSESCKNLVKNNNGGFTVRETGNSSKVYTVTKIAKGADDSHVVLTVANMSASAAAGVTVKYTAGTYGTIQDNAGNPMSSNSTGVNVAPW